MKREQRWKLRIALVMALLVAVVQAGIPAATTEPCEGGYSPGACISALCWWPPFVYSGIWRCQQDGTWAMCVENCDGEGDGTR